MEVEGVPVEQLMSGDIVSVSPDTPVEDAAEKLLDRGIGSLVVIDADGHLAGILTNTDFVGIVSEGEPAGESTVEEYMTAEVITVGPEEPISDAAARMIANNIHHLPVADEEGVVGMLSTTDLATHLSYA